VKSFAAKGERKTEEKERRVENPHQKYGYVLAVLYFITDENY